MSIAIVAGVVIVLAAVYLAVRRGKPARGGNPSGPWSGYDPADPKDDRRDVEPR